ncbi:MAG: hypothetical protein MR387_00745 [Phocaeicola plebeius]|nr:hypothetical protein [Phocaeicola plebeius]
MGKITNDHWRVIINAICTIITTVIGTQVVVTAKVETEKSMLHPNRTSKNPDIGSQ